MISIFFSPGFTVNISKLFIVNSFLAVCDTQILTLEKVACSFFSTNTNSCRHSSMQKLICFFSRSLEQIKLKGYSGIGAQFQNREGRRGRAAKDDWQNKNNNKKKNKTTCIFSACSSWNFLSNCTTCCFQPPVTAEGWWTLTVSLFISLSFRRCLTWSAVLTSWLWRTWITEKNTASKLRSSSLCRASTAPAALWNASLPSDNTGMKTHSLISHHCIVSCRAGSRVNTCLAPVDHYHRCKFLPQRKAAISVRNCCRCVF